MRDEMKWRSEMIARDFSMTRSSRPTSSGGPAHGAPGSNIAREDSSMQAARQYSAGRGLRRRRCRRRRSSPMAMPACSALIACHAERPEITAPSINRAVEDGVLEDGENKACRRRLLLEIACRRGRPGMANYRSLTGWARRVVASRSEFGSAYSTAARRAHAHGGVVHLAACCSLNAIGPPSRRGCRWRPIRFWRRRYSPWPRQQGGRRRGIIPAARLRAAIIISPLAAAVVSAFGDRGACQGVCISASSRIAHGREP